MLTDLLAGIKDLVFPNNCLLCRSFIQAPSRAQLCSTCLKGIPRNAPPFRIDPERHYDMAWGACLYEGPVRDLTHAFKYNGKTSLRKTFAGLMTEFIDAYSIPLAQFDIVAPIPLHPVRLRERGFNQSELLSEAVCRHYSLNHRPRLLLRPRATETQSLLDGKQRWTNLEGAFKMNPSESVSDKAVLVVDDLLTTGATANAAAACLKQAGASYVGVLTLSVT